MKLLGIKLLDESACNKLNNFGIMLHIHQA